jgi:serine/threonine-protein kinase
MPTAASNDAPVARRALEQLTTEWSARGIDVSTVRIDDRGTVRPAHQRVDSGDPLRGLPPLVTVRGANPLAVELGDTIGEGGMAVVCSGRQTPLRRDVAVKLLRDNDTAPEATRQLLREARVTGALEHPNVVPVHALGRDERGRPLIIMKRIEGSSWAEVLENDAPLVAHGNVARIQRHLDILLDVARAVHFAHSRGIVHRDLKPHNVMIGAFDEVYLLDWGIAVSLEDDDPRDVPRAADVDCVSGTPGYMAPEMAAGDGAQIDARTDVYLLGAVLHEIVTGEPPHEADTLLEMLTTAFASRTPEYPPEVPAGLAEICLTAMARFNDDRYQTAQAFAHALQHFLSTRDSLVLTDQAEDDLELLQKELVGARRDDSEQNGRIYNLFNRCRFGFAHALRIWDGNSRAREQLQRAVERMIDYELEFGSAGAAAALVPELPIALPDISARISASRDAEKRTTSELARLQHGADPTVADLPRALLSIVMAVVTGAGFPILGHLRRIGWRIDHFELAVAAAFFMLCNVAVALVKRSQLIANASNLRMHLTLLMIYACYAGLWPLCGLLGIGIPQSFVLVAFASVILWTSAAITVDRRLVTNGLSAAVALPLLLAFPRYGFELTGASFFVGSGTLAWLRLRTRSAEQARPLSRRIPKR